MNIKRTLQTIALAIPLVGMGVSETAACEDGIAGAIVGVTLYTGGKPITPLSLAEKKNGGPFQHPIHPKFIESLDEVFLLSDGLPIAPPEESLSEAFPLSDGLPIAPPEAGQPDKFPALCLALKGKLLIPNQGGAWPQTAAEMDQYFEQIFEGGEALF
jgi:hypothetical protein